LLLTVTDNHGASASTSIIVHVSLTPDVGQADVEVTFNDWLFAALSTVSAAGE